MTEQTEEEWLDELDRTWDVGMPLTYQESRRLYTALRAANAEVERLKSMVSVTAAGMDYDAIMKLAKDCKQGAEHD